jgi:hypothetical protein
MNNILLDGPIGVARLPRAPIHPMRLTKGGIRCAVPPYMLEIGYAGSK